MFGEDKILKVVKGIKDVKDFVDDVTKLPGELISLPLQYGSMALDYSSSLKTTFLDYWGLFSHKDTKKNTPNHEDIKNQDLESKNNNVV